jgi:hypothetical protein
MSAEREMTAEDPGGPAAHDAIAPAGGLSARQAAAVRGAIIGLCVLSLVFVFQPFWMPLYSIGAGLVVLGGLLFNIVPLCRRGVPAATLVRAAVIVLVSLVIVAALSIGAAFLYGLYRKSLQG